MSKSKAAAAPEPAVINDNNLTRAWSRLLLDVLEGAGTEVSPLVLSLTGFDEKGAVTEDPAARHTLDQLLKHKNRLSIENVAFTIFPQRLWQMCRGDRPRLFALYRATFPRWQAMNKKANGRGLYFERMVMYGRGPCNGNQLEWILSQYGSRVGVRRSMLQATTFDPGRDHVASAFETVRHAETGISGGGLPAVSKTNVFEIDHRGRSLAGETHEAIKILL